MFVKPFVEINLMFNKVKFTVVVSGDKKEVWQALKLIQMYQNQYVIPLVICQNNFCSVTVYR